MEGMNTNTPETDANLIDIGHTLAKPDTVSADFARKLERERDEARQERDLQCTIKHKLINEVEQLRKVADELAGSVKAEFGFDNWRLAPYSQLPHVKQKEQS